MESHAGARTIPVPAAMVGVGLAGAFAAAAFRRIGDFDLPWHLAYGRAIVQTRSLPRVDDLAFTHRPIQYAEFLSDLFLYGVASVGGPLGLQLVGAAMVVTIGALLLLASRRHAPGVALVVASALCAMNAWLIVRPASLSFVLLAALALAIEVHRRNPASRAGRRALVLTIPLQLLWANVHGFAIVGAALLAGYLATRVIARVAKGRWPSLCPPQDGQDLAWSAGVIGLAVFATMLNMAGPRLLLGPSRAMADTSRVTEWMPTSAKFLILQEPLAGAFLVLATLALVLGRDADTGRRAPQLLDIGTVSLAAALGASAVRLIPLAAILLVPVVARRLAGVVPATLPTTLACAAAMLAVGPVMVLRPGTSLGVGWEQSHFPDAAVGFIRSSRPQGHVWNFLPYGGYLSWRLYPEVRVMVDGRTGWVHDPALLSRYFASTHDRAEFLALATDLDLQWAIVRAVEGETFGAPLAADQGWTMVYWDDISAIYVRSAGPNAPLASRGYRLLRHLTPPGFVLHLAMARGPRVGDLVDDVALAAAQAPDSSRAAFLQACGAIARRDPHAWNVALARFGRLAPGHPAIGVLQSAWAHAAEP